MTSINSMGIIRMPIRSQPVREVSPKNPQSLADKIDSTGSTSEISTYRQAHFLAHNLVVRIVENGEGALAAQADKQTEWVVNSLIGE